MTKTKVAREVELRGAELTDPGRVGRVDGARRLQRVARLGTFLLACCRFKVDREPDILQQHHTSKIERHETRNARARWASCNPLLHQQQPWGMTFWG